MMRKKQSGAVLVISLVILFSLTLFVLSASQTGTMQEKMAAAVRDIHISLEIAESGVRDAEIAIEALTDISSFADDGSNGFYTEGNGPADLFASTSWSNAKTAAATTTVSGQVARYFIEDMGLTSFTASSSSVGMTGYGGASAPGSLRLFKVVARSLGRSGNTERVIVSYYAKDF